MRYVENVQAYLNILEVAGTSARTAPGAQATSKSGAKLEKKPKAPPRRP